MVIKTAFQVFLWLLSQQLQWYWNATDRQPAKIIVNLKREELYLFINDSDFNLVKGQNSVIPVKYVRSNEHWENI